MTAMHVNGIDDAESRAIELQQLAISSHASAMELVSLLESMLSNAEFERDEARDDLLVKWVKNGRGRPPLAEASPNVEDTMEEFNLPERSA